MLGELAGAGGETCWPLLLGGATLAPRAGVVYAVQEMATLAATIPATQALAHLRAVVGVELPCWLADVDAWELQGLSRLAALREAIARAKAGEKPSIGEL